MHFLFNSLCVISWVSGRPSSKREWVDSVLHGGGGSHIHGFPSYDETHYILDSYAQWNPLFTRRILTGISVKCRPLWAYWLSGTGLWHDPVDVRKYLEALSKDLMASILNEEAELIDECASQNTTEQFLASLKKYRSPKSSDTTHLESIGGWPNYGKSFFTSLHHAREPTSLTTPFYAYLRTLQALNSQATTPSNDEMQRDNRVIAALIAQREILWMPFVNPDGYIDIAEGADPNIRKNRRITCDKKRSTQSGPTRPSLLQRLLPPQRTPNINLHENGLPDYHEGVDINRNYDDHFVQAHNP